jgi:hypothetical protein
MSLRKSGLKRTLPRLLCSTLTVWASPDSVWDRAGIDFLQWRRWKHGDGIYFLSREKENMALSVLGLNHIDSQDPINEGILADEIVGTSNGVEIRRVTYQDPETGTTSTLHGYSGAFLK